MFPKTACTSSTFGNTSVPWPGLEREAEKFLLERQLVVPVSFALFVVVSSVHEKPWEKGTPQGPGGY